MWKVLKQIVFQKLQLDIKKKKKKSGKIQKAHGKMKKTY